MTVWKNMAVVGDADGRMLGQELTGKIAWIKWVISDDGLLYCGSISSSHTWTATMTVAPTWDTN